MAGVGEERWPPFENGGGWRTRGKGPHDDVEVRVAYALVNAPSIARFLDGVELDEFRVNKLKDGYRVMLKGRKGKRHVVAFFNEETWRDVIRLAVTSLDIASTRWRPDKYPPRPTF